MAPNPESHKLHGCRCSKCIRGETWDNTMPKILLAEDNPADVYLIREALQENGVECTMQVASDGKEVLDIISSTEPVVENEPLGLIILDLNLPRHDGIEILERLRESTRLAHVPVVVLTSSDSPQDRLVATHLGARRYLRKPSSLEQFLDLGAVFKELLLSAEAGDIAHTKERTRVKGASDEN
jgi:CheY-like chemotaxis protein